MITLIGVVSSHKYTYLMLITLVTKSRDPLSKALGFAVIFAQGV